MSLDCSFFKLNRARQLDDRDQQQQDKAYQDEETHDSFSVLGNDNAILLLFLR